MLSDNRIIYNYFTNVLSWIVVTIVFGGIDPESKVELNTQFFIVGIMWCSPMHKGMLGWS